MDIKEIRRQNLRQLISDTLENKQFETQEKFAEEVQIDPTYLSMMLMLPSQKGSRSVSENKARQVESKLGLPTGFLDRVNDEEHPLCKSQITKGVIRPTDTSEDDLVIIPAYDIKAACGTGYTNQDELIKEGIVFKESFLRGKGLSFQFENTGIVYGDGESMTPTINHNDANLVDLRIKTLDEVISGKIYVFVANKELRIKRFFKNIDGSLRISSDNPDKSTYPDEIVSRENLNALELKGRIKWRSGDL
ncbi:S24 family peptidase [Acinetobacter sp. VNK23]|uniref:S24 family peptidase n=1 Tax=Acinetobacter thutiue TaxID=2998078 RepID=UPI0025770877|nr:S24 family peptidase [Acinetobacter thutiue]MDM1021645.1 S24 family peptidase [Acinetobacter thutiue]